MPAEWRKLSDVLPSWADTGKAELRREDGTVVAGMLEIIDAEREIEGEYPVFGFKTDAGEMSIWDFCEWRLTERDNAPS